MPTPAPNGSETRPKTCLTFLSRLAAATVCMLTVVAVRIKSNWPPVNSRAIALAVAMSLSALKRRNRMVF